MLNLSPSSDNADIQIPLVVDWLELEIYKSLILYNIDCNMLVKSVKACLDIATKMTCCSLMTGKKVMYV